jgi:hypothetical protein
VCGRYASAQTLALAVIAAIIPGGAMRALRIYKNILSNRQMSVLTNINAAHQTSKVPDTDKCTDVFNAGYNGEWCSAAIPLPAMRIKGTPDHAVLNATKDQLKTMPEFNAVSAQ